MEDVIDVRLLEYKEAFKSYIVEYCKNYNRGLYDKKDLICFDNLAENEFEVQMETVDMEDFNFENPELDAEECISYWD